jgi:Tfp pilus assembly protein FimT
MALSLRAGFSYVQLLLVVALLVILAGISAPYYLTWQARQQLRTTSSMLWADLHYAQSRAMQREQDAGWGVHFDNSTHSYTLFHGSTYLSSDVYNETIQYSSNVTITPTTDIAFAGLTGEVTSPITYTITSNSLPTETETISINVEGLIAQ